MRPRVLEYDAQGALLRSWTIDADLSEEHGVQVATSDSRGRLVLLNRSPAEALVLNTETGRRVVYARFPDLPTCPPTGGEDCSPALHDQPAMPNYAAWGRDGSLYVTDFLQAVIWRVPPRGGAPEIWLADPRLDGDQFGTTGIVLEPDHRTLAVAQQSSAGLGEPNPTTGKLYSVPIRPTGRPGPLTKVWESEPVDGPDGFWLDRAGRFWIALAGANQLVVVSPEGQELDRFGAAGTGDNGSPVPFDTPSSVMFLHRRLEVANQGFFSGAADPSTQAILDVYAGERGMPEFIPAGAGPGDFPSP
jgi:sugar lactone lactonase YvrE